ncbi:MAG: hypothetical protein ACYSUV_21140, partial [Planctomycetota bacterium]
MYDARAAGFCPAGRGGSLADRAESSPSRLWVAPVRTQKTWRRQRHSKGWIMFVDEAKIWVKAGDGGHGCVSFRR